MLRGKKEELENKAESIIKSAVASALNAVYGSDLTFRRT